MLDKLVAFYMRSSKEQEAGTRNKRNPDESDTIANQRQLLYKVAAEKGFTKDKIREYADDGYTGTNFRRPDFERLLKDVEAGIIGTVMVKDFSRMGRDYIGVGEYVEQYFPMRGIRVIAVNDGWDSDEHIGETLELDASFRTMIYDMYSQDLSVKRKSANQARNKNGIFIGGFVPYGYKKDEKDGHKIVVDERTAPVVQRIFRMFNEGEKIGVIAQVLNEEGVITRAQAKEAMHSYEGVAKGPDVWSDRSVSTILKNEIYTGTLVLNRMSIKKFRDKSCRPNDQSEWMRFPDNHEAIISREEYEKAQKRIARPAEGYNPVKKIIYPLYCGHCGRKLSGTTRNEGVLVCSTGINKPFEPCGQMQVSKKAVEGILLKAINTQARVFIDNLKNTRASSKKIREKRELVERLKEEQQGYHDARLDLYKQFKQGAFDKEAFLSKKAELLKLEEESIAELDAATEKLNEMENDAENRKMNAEPIRGYALMKDFDYGVANRLIGRAEVFNDGRMKISWNFKAEFQNAPDVDAGDKEARTDAGHKKAAVYTSDLYLMPQDEEWTVKRDRVMDYCKEKLGAGDGEILSLHDSKEDAGLLYKKGFTQFIDIGRRKAADVLVIDSFADLYLSERGLSDLLRWVIPKLEVRFISIRDGFDSLEADEEDYARVYEMYKGSRKGDILKYRVQERKEGKREAREPKKPRCRRVYGYTFDDNGCYEDKESLDTVKRIYRLVDEKRLLRSVARVLNEEGVPTPGTVLARQGCGRCEKKPRWNAEKVWIILRNEAYVSECRYRDKCMALGKKCERRPVVERELFDELNECCRYREDR